MEQILKLENNQFITYKYLNIDSNKDFELLYLHGFCGGMDGDKGILLENIAKENSVNLIKLNYLGHGTSSGKVTDFTITDWLDNIKTIINMFSKRKLILIGSSMGAWLAYLIALDYKDKIKSIITLSSAIDFLTEIIEPAIGNRKEYEIITSDGYNTGCIVTKKLLNDGKQYSLMNKNIAEIDCPIRMIHGLKDNMIPYSVPLKFFEKLNSKDAEFMLIKEMDHRLSMDGNLELLKDVIVKMI